MLNFVSTFSGEDQTRPTKGCIWRLPDAERFFKHLLVKTDNYLLAGADSRGAQIAGTA